MAKRSTQKPNQRNAEQRARIAFADKAAADLNGMVRAYQATGYDMFVEFLAGEIETDGGRIVYSNRNLTKVQRLVTMFTGWGNKFKRYILKPILQAAEKLLGFNRDYFNAISTVKDSLTVAARQEALKLWGYDVAKDTILPGGYLDLVFQGNPVTGRIAALMNQAIGAKMKLSDFQKLFRSVFVGKPGAGMLEQYFKSATFDLYQRLDRIAARTYALKLKLKYYIYSGTVMDKTRKFCEDRVNKIFLDTEVEAWASLPPWPGRSKNKPYNPFFDCGDINCRHHLSPVSNEVGEVMYNQQNGIK